MKKFLFVMPVLFFVLFMCITGNHFYIKQTDYSNIYETTLQANWDIVNFYETIVELDEAEKIEFFICEREENILSKLETHIQRIENIVHNRYYENKGNYYISCLNEIYSHKEDVLALKLLYTNLEAEKTYETINYDMVIQEKYKSELMQATIRENLKETKKVNYFDLDLTFFQLPILSDIELYVKREVRGAKFKQRASVKEELNRTDNIYYDLKKEHIDILNGLEDDVHLIEFLGSKAMKKYTDSLKEVISQEHSIASKVPVLDFNIDMATCIFEFRQAEKIYAMMNDENVSVDEKIRKAQNYKKVFVTIDE